MYFLYINLLVAFNLFSFNMNNPSNWYVAKLQKTTFAADHVINPKLKFCRNLSPVGRSFSFPFYLFFFFFVALPGGFSRNPKWIQTNKFSIMGKCLFQEMHHMRNCCNRTGYAIQHILFEISGFGENSHSLCCIFSDVSMTSACISALNVYAIGTGGRISSNRITIVWCACSCPFVSVVIRSRCSRWWWRCNCDIIGTIDFKHIVCLHILYSYFAVIHTKHTLLEFGFFGRQAFLQLVEILEWISTDLTTV